MNWNGVASSWWWCDVQSRVDAAVHLSAIDCIGSLCHLNDFIGKKLTRQKTHDSFSNGRVFYHLQIKHQISYTRNLKEVTMHKARLQVCESQYVVELKLINLFA